MGEGFGVGVVLEVGEGHFGMVEGFVGCCWGV